MPLGLFHNIGSEVNISDKRHVHYLKKRLIPFSRTPFRHNSRDSTIDTLSLAPTLTNTTGAPLIRPPKHRTDTGISSYQDLEPDQWDDEPIGERPPFWMELSADLAWTATFSSLTSNTEISDASTIVSYAVFFALMWQLWASQAVYDIKFYTNDWWHRFAFIFQLIIYGGLAAFTAEFDVFWHLKQNDDVFVGLNKGLAAQAILNNAERTRELSFQGIALLLACSRFFLLLQYLRVIYYRYRHKVSSWLYMLAPISLLISSVLFLVCFLIIKIANPSRATSIVQFLLWTSAMLVEALGHAFTPDDAKEKLRGHGSLTGRLSTLTVIVMGEGLNGLCSTLRSTVNAVGFGGHMILVIICAAFMLYFYWLLYFDGFRERLPPRKSAKEIWLLLHLPFQLSLILFLEGMKNLMLYTNMNISTKYFIDLLLSPEVNPGDGFKSSAKMEHVLQKLGLSWEQQLLDSNAAFGKSVVEGQMQYSRWVMTVMYRLFKSYDKSIDQTAQFYYEQYMSDDTYVKEDVQWAAAHSWQSGFGQYWTRVISEFENPYIAAVISVVPVAGTLLFFLGLLNYTQNRPSDKYAWGSVLNKCLAGLVMITLTATAAAKSHAVLYAIIMWRMPMIAIVLALVVSVEFTLLWFSVRSIKKQESGQMMVQTTSRGDPGGARYSMVQNPAIQQQGALQAQPTGNSGIFSETASLYSGTTTYPPPGTGIQPLPSGALGAMNAPHTAAPTTTTFHPPPPPDPRRGTSWSSNTTATTTPGILYPPPPPPPLPGFGDHPTVVSSPATYFPPQPYGPPAGGNYDPWNTNRR